MRPNLDSLTEEIKQYLEAEHFVVYHAFARNLEQPNLIPWDSQRHPDFHAFLDCAAKLGVRLVTFHQREFDAGFREEAQGMLKEADLPKETKRGLERRINDLAIYEGFLCGLELAFDYDSRTYVFSLETEWFEDWHEIMDEIEDAIPGEDPEEDPFGYYSNN